MPEKKVRTVVHNGRRRSTGEAYSPKHNSRSGGIGDHVLANPERKNIYITLDFDGNPTMHEQVDFEKHEREFYEVFRPSLEAQNERYRKKGNKDRILTMDEYREVRPPVETILQVGNKDMEVPPEVTRIAVAKWIDQMRSKYGSRYKIIDVAIHYDEPGTGGGICADGSRSKNTAGHAHIRSVFCAEGKDGWVVSESKALAQLGITYDDSRARSRYNNPQITFTQEARELFNQLVKEQNVAVETVPARPGKRTMTKEEYITEQLREHQEELRKEAKNLSDECLEIQTEAALEAQRRDQLIDEVVVLTKKKSFLESTLRGLEKTVEYFKKTVLPIQKFFERLSNIRLWKGHSALDELLDNDASAYTAIYTKEQLSNLSPNGKYILICDIDLEGAKWTPIGTETSPFKGTFDGNGYTISNFTISTSFEKLGLFGYNTGVIKNLSVNNFVFEINRSISNIGGLVGYNKGTIENCHVQGYITAKAFVSRDSAGRYGAGIVVGGLAGYNFHGNVYNSSAAVNIFAESEGGKQGTNEVSIYAEAGGLVGSNYGIIQNCTSSGSVEAIAISTATGYEGLKVVASGEAGGLVGSNMIGAKIINCYSTGEVKATSIVGGLVAENNGNIENCFSSIIVSASQGYENKIKFAGGVVGKNGVGSVNNSYYYNAQTISGINSIGSPLDIKTLKSYEFQVQTLGWSSDSWEFKNGYFPALK